MNTIIKCTNCGTIHEHPKPLTLPGGDIKNYRCSNCKALGHVKILRGANGMFTDERYCMCGTILEEGEHLICKDCR